MEPGSRPGADGTVTGAAMGPRVLETAERSVQAVRDGDDAAIRTLPAGLSVPANPAALLCLRERPYRPP
ncbi:hypothetical protein [Streptomyces sp. NPDC059979]|uniref:hypothetical protein n=1 Tax=Streptomyces sp. NPDC059979 TaxID=3347021 RepID=UPI003686FA51